MEMLTFDLRATYGPFRVRYDPASPDRVATSWGWSSRHNRACVLVAIAVGFAAVLWRIRHHFAALWRAARLRRVPLHPVAAQVLDIRPRIGRTEFTLSWTDPAGMQR